MALFASGHKIKELLVVPEEGEPIDLRLQSGLISYYDLIFGFYQDRDAFDHIKIFLRDDKLILSLYIIFCCRWLHMISHYLT